MNIETVPISSVLPDPANVRRHDEKNLTAIKGSLARFGQQKPLVVGRNNVVLAGNGTLAAAKALAWKEIQIVRTDLEGVDATAFGIADNRSAELAGWDNAELAALLQEIGELEGTGFTDDDLAALLDDVGQHVTGLTDPDEVPETPDDAETYVEPGDMYELGLHRIFCGDSTDPTVVDRLLDGSTVDCTWADPPWNVAYGKDDHPTYKKRQIANDDLGKAFPGFCAGFAAQIARVSKPGAPLYMAMSAQEWPVIDAALRAAGFHWSATIIWAKDSLVLSRGDYHRQYEPLWYGWRDGAARLHPVKDRKQSDLWQIDRPKRSDLHPTTKPVELVTRSLRNSSTRGNLVFEPFSGSGTTLLACEQEGRVCRAVEVEGRYVQVAIERWQAFTGEEARKV